MEQTEKQKKLEIIDLLRSRISVMKNYQHNMDRVSWFDHVGILLSCDDAQVVLDCLEKDIDDHIRETGAVPNLGWLIEKIRFFYKWLRKEP